MGSVQRSIMAMLCAFGTTVIREAMMTPLLIGPIKRTDVPDERIWED